MIDDARKHPRARVPGLRATFARGDAEDAADEVRNLSKGGVFLATTKPLAIGKLLHLELRAPGDAQALTATGRVVWTREHESAADRPAGMAVKFVDVEEGALEVIGRLVEANATAATAAPQRERTVMGVGGGDATEKMPLGGRSREATIIGVAPAPDEPRPAEPAPKPPKIDEPKPPKPPKIDEPKRAAPAPSAKSGSGATWVLVLIALAVIGFFLFKDRILGDAPAPAPSASARPR